MSRPRRTETLAARRCPPAGSIRWELGLGLLIVVLAAALALEVLGRVQSRRRRDRFVADLQELAAIVQQRAQTPATWQRSTPFGGSYEWRRDAKGGFSNGAIVVTAFAPSFPLTATRADLLRIDEALDDGDLTTGNFRTGFNGWPLYRVDTR